MDIRKLIYQINNQYDWRPLYKRCHDFVNGYQYTDEQIKKANDLQLNLRVFNLMKAPIKTLEGTEQRTRVDYLLKPRNEESTNATAALNAELNRVEKTTKSNKAISKAFYSAIVGGVGFVRFEENREIGDKYVCRHIPTENIYWDMQRDNQLLENSTWITVRNVYERGEAKALFPQYADSIDSQVSGSFDFNFGGTTETLYGASFIDTFRNSLINLSDDSIVISEIFYKEKSRVEVYTDESGAQHDCKDLPKEVKDTLRYSKQTQKKVKTKIMRAVYIGALEIENKKYEQPHNEFPIIPIWGDITNTYNTPRGIAAEMIDPQIDYNDFKLQMASILKNRRIFIEEDSVQDMSMNEIVNEFNRQDSAIAYKKGAQKPEVVRDFNELYRLQGLLTIAKDEIRECSGLTYSFTGDVKGASGKAIAHSSDLASSSSASIFDSRDSAKVKLGEIMIAHIKKDIGDKKTELLLDNNYKRVEVNSRTPDGKILNPLAEIKFNIELASIQTSAGFMQLQADRLVAMANNAREPVMQAILQVEALRMEDIPNKDKIIPLIHKKLGIEELSSDEDKDMERQKAEAEAQAKAAEIEEIKTKLEFEREAAEIEKLKAETQLKLAEAKNKADEVSRKVHEEFLEAKALRLNR